MEKKKLHSSVKKLMTVILRSGVFMQIDVLFVISSCYLYTYIYIKRARWKRESYISNKFRRNINIAFEERNKKEKIKKEEKSKKEKFLF